MGWSVGTIIAGSIGVGALGITALSMPFVAPAFRRVCIPYVPATSQQLANISKALEKCHNIGSLIDLGSGDGRVVIHCAKRGIKSDGVELNRVLVWYSRFNSLKNKTYPMTKFYRKDFFNVDLKKYDTTILFGAESTMEALLDKLNEMNKDSYLIACRFPLPKNGEEHWKIISENGEGIDTAWLYKKIA